MFVTPTFVSKTLFCFGYLNFLSIGQNLRRLPVWHELESVSAANGSSEGCDEKGSVCSHVSIRKTAMMDTIYRYGDLTMAARRFLWWRDPSWWNRKTEKWYLTSEMIAHNKHQNISGSKIYCIVQYYNTDPDWWILPHHSLFRSVLPLMHIIQRRGVFIHGTTPQCETWRLRFALKPLFDPSSFRFVGRWMWTLESIHERTRFSFAPFKVSHLLSTWKEDILYLKPVLT